MSRKITALALVWVAGCHRQSFDERYQDAQHKVEGKAGKIDQDLAAAASDAAAAGVLPSGDAADAATNR